MQAGRRGGPTLNLIIARIDCVPSVSTTSGSLSNRQVNVFMLRTDATAFRPLMEIDGHAKPLNNTITTFNHPRLPPSP